MKKTCDKKKKLITVKELLEFLSDKRIVMDCGHKYCLHPFSNTMVIHASGKVECSECYQGY